MDDDYNFVWVSTRNYPQDFENLQHGVFDQVTRNIPVATLVHGTFYIRELIWIVMDQEINRDGSLLFYVNAHFANPPGEIPLFSNISLAIHNPDGSYREHPNAVEIMYWINNYIPSQYLRYGPSSLGTQGLELFFTNILYQTNRMSVLSSCPKGRPLIFLLGFLNGFQYLRVSNQKLQRFLWMVRC